jgi:Leucine-rich repeat (LRR) protein
MSSLELLSLTHCSMGSLKPGVFQGLASLRSLVLDACEISDIEGSFVPLEGLTYLSLAYCRG